MKCGVRPVPTKLKLLRGNPGKREVYPEPEPLVPDLLPAPPEFLSDYAMQEWRRMVVELYRLQLLTMADLHPLAAYCQAYGRWRTAEETLKRMAENDPVTHALIVKGYAKNPIQNPIVKIADRAAADMVRYASEFGLTPVARTRLAAAPEATTSKFTGLLAG